MYTYQELEFNVGPELLPVPDLERQKQLALFDPEVLDAVMLDLSDKHDAEAFGASLEAMHGSGYRSIPGFHEIKAWPFQVVNTINRIAVYNYGLNYLNIALMERRIQQWLVAESVQIDRNSTDPCAIIIKTATRPRRFPRTEKVIQARRLASVTDLDAILTIAESAKQFDKRA